MNQDIKKKWLDALRSDEYQQETEVLRSEEGFCCLGVLCDLYAKDYDVKWDDLEDGNYTFLGKEEVLPPEVVSWAELDEDDPWVNTDEDNSDRLSSLNDGGYSFKDIADLIETSL